MAGESALPLDPPRCIRAVAGYYPAAPLHELYVGAATARVP
jgi:hypothetical protein